MEIKVIARRRLCLQVQLYGEWVGEGTSMVLDMTIVICGPCIRGSAQRTAEDHATYHGTGTRASMAYGV